MRSTHLTLTVVSVAALAALGGGCTFFDDAAPPPDVTLTTATSLVVIEEEPPGDDCEAGGQRVTTGLDGDGDNALSEDEIEGTGLICNGADGASGTGLDDLACEAGQTPVFDGAAWFCQPQVVDTDTDTLATLACVDGQLAKWNGSAWACAADDTADPGTDTLANLTCGVDQIAKFNGASWFCSEDVDTVTVNTDTLAMLPCQNGEVPKRMGATWVCATDLDTTIANTDTLADLSCADGEVAKYNGTAWACAADLDTTIANTDTLAGLSCASGEVAKYNGTAWVCATDDDTGGTNTDTLADLSCADGEVAKYNGAAWACAVDVDTTIANTDTLADLSCNTGEVAKYDGASWACAADDNDDTTLDPATLWAVGGNAGTTAGDYLGTSDDAVLELRVNDARALQLVPDAISPSIIGGHPDNSLDPAVAYGAVIGGGGEAGAANAVYDPYGVVAGGADNVAGADNALDTEDFATVGGGVGNVASGASSTVPGGIGNTASGAGSFAAGTQAQAVHDGAIVLADSTAADFSSSAADEFAVRANGGVRFVIGGCEVTLDAAGAWTAGGGCTSDRHVKHGLEDVDAEQLLARLNAIDIGTWAYDGREERHLGPMAQDFHAAFGLGVDDKRIHPLDAAGVSLKAIQALSVRTEALLAQNQRLAEKNAALEARLLRLEAQAQGGGEEAAP